MKNTNFVLGIALAAALVILQVGAVYAAPLSATVPDGTIVSVTPTFDSNNVLTGYQVVVTGSSGQQTVDLTVQEAIAEGIVSADGTTILAKPGDMIVSGMLQTSTSEPTNPVAAALQDFFCGSSQPTTPTSPTSPTAPTGGGGTTSLCGDKTITELHDAGNGYGEIAQACFMADILGSDCTTVMTDKSSKDFSNLGVPSDVNNWGRLRQYAMGKLGDKLGNLGSIMSGRATSPLSSPSTTGPTTSGPENTMGPNNSGPTTNTGPQNTQSHGNNGKHKGGHGHGHKP